MEALRYVIRCVAHLLYNLHHLFLRFWPNPIALIQYERYGGCRAVRRFRNIIYGYLWHKSPSFYLFHTLCNYYVTMKQQIGQYSEGIKLTKSRFSQITD